MKKIIKILFLFIIVNANHGYSQNLVLNPSFEDTLAIYSRIVKWNDTVAYIMYEDIDLLTKYWKSSRYITEYNHTVISDYYRICYPNSTKNPLFGSPKNYFTNYRTARTGDAYIGHSNMLFWQTNLYENFYHSCGGVEIVTGQLKLVLERDIKYKVSLYVGTTRLRSGLFSNALDIVFGSNFEYFQAWESDPDTCWCGMVQIPFPDLSLDRSIMITDTIGWQKVEFEYIARGNEKFISIGNFRKRKCPGGDFDLIFVDCEIQGIQNGNYKYSSYFFYDDISVYPIDDPEYPADIGIKDTCINKGSPIVLGGLPKEEYLYWWYDSHDSLISRQSSITVYPTQDTSFVLVQKDFKFDETRDTVYIKVGNCTTIPNYSGYDFAIYPNPNYGDFQVRFNTAVPEGAVLELYDLLGRKLAEYPLSGSGNIANINGIEVASAIYYVTVVVPNSFRKSVKMVIMK